jgi:hypothetical protein
MLAEILRRMADVFGLVFFRANGELVKLLMRETRAQLLGFAERGSVLGGLKKALLTPRD